jgi:hypothetical protein
MLRRQGAHGRSGAGRPSHRARSSASLRSACVSGGLRTRPYTPRSPRVWCRREPGRHKILSLAGAGGRHSRTTRSPRMGCAPVRTGRVRLRRSGKQLQSCFSRLPHKSGCVLAWPRSSLPQAMTGRVVLLRRAWKLSTDRVVPSAWTRMMWIVGWRAASVWCIMRVSSGGMHWQRVHTSLRQSWQTTIATSIMLSALKRVISVSCAVRHAREYGCYLRVIDLTHYDIARARRGRSRQPGLGYCIGIFVHAHV